MQTWNAVELRRFLDHVADDRMSAAWLLLAMTGMRRGEALGLRWRSVDLDSARVSVKFGHAYKLVSARSVDHLLTRAEERRRR